MVLGSIERGQARSLAVREAIGKAKRVQTSCCAKDTLWRGIGENSQFLFVHCSKIGNSERVRHYQARIKRCEDARPVSYTHLTLPTSDLV